jgi:hypothetical protein
MHVHRYIRIKRLRQSFRRHLERTCPNHPLRFRVMGGERLPLWTEVTPRILLRSERNVLRKADRDRLRRRNYRHLADLLYYDARRINFEFIIKQE